MAEYKYGTNFTSVKVRHAPGGQSSINLGWDDPPPPPSFKNDGRNSEKRNAVQDPFKSREGPRYQDSEDFKRFDIPQRAPQIPPPFHSNLRENPSNAYIKPMPSYSPNAPVNFSENYFQPKVDPYGSHDYQVPQNYFRPPENEGNYFKPQEAYQGGYAAAIREQPGFAGPPPGLPPRAPAYEQGIFKQEMGGFPGGGQGGQAYQVNPQQPRYYSPNQKSYPPTENYAPGEPRGGYQVEDRRGAAGYVKNSIKISNPPGGQSTFSFG